MKISSYTISYVIICLMAVSPSVAETTFGNIDLGVSAYMDAGRFQLDSSESTRDGEFLSRAGARWSVEGKFSEQFSAFTNLHWLWWRNQGTDLGLFHIAGIKFDSDLEAFLEYRPGDAHLLRAGLFEYKYNRDSKNLGEYLLRSEAYPSFIETAQGVDLMRPSHARIGGLQYELMLGNLRQTALLYLEQTNMPVNDMSVAYFAALSPAGFEIEAGLAHRRFFNFGDRVNNSLLLDTLRAYIEDQGLTAEASSVMLRGHIDFNELLGLSLKEGFKLYAETALLGFKQDTLYYTSSSERMPFLVGIDIPTGGILSHFAFELERFTSPYYDKEYSMTDQGGTNYSPLPALNTENEYLNALPSYHRDDLKWSLFLTKSLNQWVDLKVRAANDHLRLLDWDKNLANGGRPVTVKPKDWYFLIRIDWHN